MTSTSSPNSFYTSFPSILPSLLYSLIEKHKNPRFLSALNFIEATLTTYGVSHSSFSFNGGKDCTVLLELLRVALWRVKGYNDVSQLNILHFHESDEFDEISEFMNFMKERYNMTIIELKGQWNVELSKLMSTEEGKSIECIYMGQRRDDWGEGMRSDFNIIAPSDTQSGWPPHDRIWPLLDWSYNEIWEFLFAFELPYCELYVHGFSSIGNRLNSIPNPYLWNEDQAKFQHAKALNNPKLERGGRLKNMEQNERDIMIELSRKREAKDKAIRVKEVENQKRV